MFIQVMLVYPLIRFELEKRQSKSFRIDLDNNLSTRMLRHDTAIRFECVLEGIYGVNDRLDFT